MVNLSTLRLGSVPTWSCFAFITSLSLVARAADPLQGPSVAAGASTTIASALPPPTTTSITPGVEPQGSQHPQLSVPIAPAEPAKPSKGFLDFNSYPYMTDVDSDSVFTLNALAKLPHGFSYFSLLNLMNQSDHQPLADTTGYYTEQNLRFAPSELVPLDLTVQYNLTSGDDNDRLRFGFLWKLHDTPFVDQLFDAIHLTYAVNFHLFQVDHEESYV